MTLTLIGEYYQQIGKQQLVPNASHQLDGAYIKEVILSFLER